MRLRYNHAETKAVKHFIPSVIVFYSSQQVLTINFHLRLHINRRDNSTSTVLSSGISGSTQMQLVAVPVSKVPDMNFVYGLLKLYDGESELSYPVQGEPIHRYHHPMPIPSNAIIYTHLLS